MIVGFSLIFQFYIRQYGLIVERLRKVQFLEALLESLRILPLEPVPQVEGVMGAVAIA
ncbi:hypothetical protein BDD14_2903 [Edaphobacter modestus]|uniref:Uncharacterized protein n=2 Tax=Edaphobacter modestus TaxID=388466 RepID=A0A4Q7YW30_9BACT|nr:hypothetical protein BDD14_2903 [Edaphobacter modestus]